MKILKLKKKSPNGGVGIQLFVGVIGVKIGVTFVEIGNLTSPWRGWNEIQQGVSQTWWIFSWLTTLEFELEPSAMGPMKGQFVENRVGSGRS